MKKKRKQKQKKAVNYNRLGLLTITVVVLLFLGGLYISSQRLEQRLQMYNIKKENLDQRIADEKERTVEIDNLKDYMKTDEYAEEVARERLGLVKPDEIVFQEEKLSGIRRRIAVCRQRRNPFFVSCRELRKNQGHPGIL